jgi:DNA-binding transcriptional LysR family regulator
LELGVELRHLRYFATVADEQNFGRAALRLFISQSTLSEQIQSLENEVGGALLTRTSRRFGLTDAGRLLLPEALRLIAQADHALRATRAVTAGEVGSIRIGFSGVVALSGLLRDNLREFRTAHPFVEVELVEAAPSVLIEHLRNGIVDVAYTPDLGEADDVSSRHKATFRPIVAVPEGHAYAERASVHLTELVGQPLVVFATEHDVWAADLLSEVVPEYLRTGTSTLGVLALVSAGSGVAVVPSVLEQVGMPGVSYVPLAGAPGIVIVIAVRRGENGPVVQEFLRISNGA